MADGWTKVSYPEDMGLSSTALLRFFAQHKGLGIHSLALVREGKVCAIAARPWHEELPHTLDGVYHQQGQGWPDSQHGKRRLRQRAVQVRAGRAVVT